jgi:hypothetical protein
LGSKKLANLTLGGHPGSLVLGQSQQNRTDDLILVSTPQWDRDIGAAANEPITGDTNVAYVLHQYTGTQKTKDFDAVRAASAKIAVWADENGATNAGRTR